MFKEFEQKVGYVFKDKTLLSSALTHASRNDKKTNNERLEFLGDRVVGLIMADMIYKAFPDEKEGDMALRHAALVQQSALVEVADNIGLASVIQASSGDLKQAGASRDTIVSDAVEALCGAIYLDGGYAAIERLVQSWWKEMVGRYTVPPQDPKTALQEWAQARGLSLPQYKVLSQTGSDHAPVFEIEIVIDGVGRVSATGSSKRIAEKEAARRMLEKIEVTG